MTTKNSTPRSPIAITCTSKHSHLTAIDKSRLVRLIQENAVGMSLNTNKKRVALISLDATTQTGEVKISDYMSKGLCEPVKWHDHTARFSYRITGQESPVQEVTTQGEITESDVYHAQLPKNVIATIKGVGVNGEVVNISVDSDEFEIELVSYPEIFSKTYKTITGAIKGALKFINNVAGSDIEVYINPAHINLLPAKWANAEARPVIKFEVGASYATDEGYVYTVTRSCVSEYSGNLFVGLIPLSLFNAIKRDRYQQYSDDICMVSYDNGSEICVRKLLYKTILRADQPVETVEIMTQGEITESDVNFTDGEWDITPTPASESQVAQPRVTIYHAQLSNSVIATIKTSGIHRYEEIDISIRDSVVGREFKIKSADDSIGFFKYYKTTSGAINGALKFLSGYYAETPDIEVYINPAHINLLPAKWANAEARPVVEFKVGQAYTTDSHGDYKVVDTGGNSFTDDEVRFALLIDVATGSDEHYCSLRHDNGSEICSFTIWTDAVNGVTSTIRADCPAPTEPTDPTTPDGSDEPTDSGNTPASESTHTTLKSAVASHFSAAAATKSFQAFYLAFYRKLAKTNSCTLEICGQMVTITRLEKGDFAVSAQSQPIAPQPEMPAPAPIDWHTIIDEIAISDFNLIDSREWADHISEAEKEFDAMMETERAEMQCDDYEAEQAIERKNSPPVPSFELFATKAPAKAKMAGRAKFVQMTGMLFDTLEVDTTSNTAKLMECRAAQRKVNQILAARRKQLGDRLPPAPLFRGI